LTSRADGFPSPTEPHSSPPDWRPFPGLLDPEILQPWTSKPQPLWTGDDWQAYALFLQRKGGQLQQSLAQALHEVQALKARLRRAKPAAASLDARRGLLDPTPTPARKRGRPAGSDAKELALAAIAKRAELAQAASPRSLTQEQAINAVRMARGERSRNPKENRAAREWMTRLQREAAGG